MIGALAAFYIRRDRNTAREWKAQPRGAVRWGEVVDNFGGEILEGFVTTFIRRGWITMQMHPILCALRSPFRALSGADARPGRNTGPVKATTRTAEIDLSLYIYVYGRTSWTRDPYWAPRTFPADIKLSFEPSPRRFVRRSFSASSESSRSRLKNAIYFKNTLSTRHFYPSLIFPARNAPSDNCVLRVSLFYSFSYYIYV